MGVGSGSVVRGRGFRAVRVREKGGGRVGVRVGLLAEGAAPPPPPGWSRRSAARAACRKDVVSN